MKICKSCNVEKPLDCFHKRSARPSGVASHCKECRKNKEKLRYEKKRDEIIKRQSEYNSKNRDKINARQRQYNQENVEKRKSYAIKNKEKIAAYVRERRNKDPLFNLASNIRRRLNYAFSVGGFTKKSKTNEILGCDWNTLVAHIEKQFVDGMSWENMGDWEIDHIIPYASAKNECDVIRLSHYKNLQPLWKRDNRKKSGKH